MRFVFLALPLLFAACSMKVDSPFSVSDDSTGIFSNRPQTATQALVLVKLKTAPLLTSMKVENGKKSVDEKQIAAIAAEQAELTKKLEELSSEIKIVYRYRWVLNGMAVAAPIALLEKIRGFANVVTADGSGTFARPPRPALDADDEKSDVRLQNLGLRNSVKFIGAEEAHAKGFRGQGMRVGIIDTGIDYTHAMLGGAGTPEAFKAVDPAKPTSAFPNAKVVGGIDLTGTTFDAGSADFKNQIPVPDANPIDEGGHGTHVAGTVAGRGDGVNTYDGVAPDALLYAIKVFGKDGSTGDAIVIAGLEYAVDPNGDGDLSDQLDAVNLSLGGGFGDPHLLYNEAVQNISRAGTVVVCAAGNSGDNSYIVGAPSVADEALSVASSVDNADHNWKFMAVKFATAENPEIYVEAIQGTIGKPIESIAQQVEGTLVYAGLADKDFSDELKAKLKGKVALIDRGGVTFLEKIRRAAEAEAIGMVVANNAAGEPIAMGGDDDKVYRIPALMVTQELGQQLKAAMANGDASIQFKTDRRIEKPQLIDSISGFSSKGPRSQDALVKPEIAAPGTQVVSALMGGGAKGIPLNGTSMATPHMAGVIALVKQARPDLSSVELKSLVMGTSRVLVDAKTKQPYPVSRQGAGRVQVGRAIEGAIVASPVAISLGEGALESRKVLARSLEVRNITKTAMSLTIAFDSRLRSNLRLSGPDHVTLEPGTKTRLDFRFVIDAANLPDTSTELDGSIRFLGGDGTEVAHVPVLAIVNKVSQLKVESLLVRATSDADAQGAVVDMTIRNGGINAGTAYPFNLLKLDARKEDASNDPFRSRSCDLAGAGYRVIQKDGASVLQVAVKLYEPITAWNNCHVSVLIDADGDGVADQELVGMKQDDLNGLEKKEFASLLIDAVKTRAIRKQFEIDTMAQKEDIKEDYTPAVEAIRPMYGFAHSTIAIVEAQVNQLRVHPSGALSIRIATSYAESSAIEPDDFLEGSKWLGISVADGGAGYVGLPEKIDLASGAAMSLSLTKGAGSEPLWLLYPQNKPVTGGLSADLQAETPSAIYKVD